MDETFFAHIYKFNFCAEFNVPHYENDMLFYHLNEIWYSWKCLKCCSTVESATMMERTETENNEIIHSRYDFTRAWVFH